MSVQNCDLNSKIFNLISCTGIGMARKQASVIRPKVAPHGNCSSLSVKLSIESERLSRMLFQKVNYQNLPSVSL